MAQKYEVGTPVREAIDTAYRGSQRLLGIAALASLVPMLVIMFFLENVRLDERTTAVEGDKADNAAGGSKVQGGEVGEKVVKG